MSCWVVVQYGVGTTEPTVWIQAGIATVSGQVCTPPQPSGTTVWMRAQTRCDNKKPSPWTTPVSTLVAPTTPQLYHFEVAIDEYDEPVVTWVDSAITLGLRLEYSVETGGDDPDYGTSVDVDATTGTYTLPVVMSSGETIYVRGTPYTGFSMGSVSGTSGTIRFAEAEQP